MGIISIVMPVIGQPDTTEDVKLQNALAILQNVINGALDTNNLSPTAGVTTAQLAIAIQDTGWNGAPAGTGFSAVAGIPAVSYRKVSDRVYLRGGYQNISGSTIASGNAVITGLPAPANQVNPGCVVLGGSPNGFIMNMAAAATSSTVNFNVGAGAIITFDNTFYHLT
jgi:hypothetical protein